MTLAGQRSRSKEQCEVSEQLAELFKENASGTLGREIAVVRCRLRTASRPEPIGGYSTLLRRYR